MTPISDQDKFFEVNRKRWNTMTGYHIQSRFYDQESFLAGRNSLTEIETQGFGDVEGQSILHLQCHFGQDSMSLARMGAKVTGVDLSDDSIMAARKFNGQLGLDCRFIQCNLYDTRTHIHEIFDCVFTSYGAICWLPDLQNWFHVIDASLKPGSRFYIVDFHPVLYMFEFEDKTVKYHYFNNSHYEGTTDGSYALKGNIPAQKEYFWNHAISEIIQPFIKAEYEILAFNEYDFSPFDCFDNLKFRKSGQYVFDLAVSIPHLFELKVRKPQ